MVFNIKVGFFATIFFFLVSSGTAVSQSYDVIIRNGRIVDGTGNPWFKGDIGISDDKIAYLGDLGDAVGKRELDATGLYVTPGFIDTHSHSGPGLSSKSLSSGWPLLSQGITTVFINPDGGGAVDLKSQKEQLMEHGIGVNVIQLVPHGSIRRLVMGTEDRSPTNPEMLEMLDLVERGMKEGAFGLSTGTFYVPGSYSEAPEIVEVAKVVAKYNGMYTSHIRDESNYTVGLISAVEEVIDVARKADLPSIVTHVKALGPPVWGYSTAIVRKIEAAREEGLEIYADQYPYLGSSTGLSAALLPRWAQSGGADSLLNRLDRPGVREDIRAAMSDNLVRRGGADRIQFRRVAFDESIEGKLLSDVAEERDESALEVALDVIRKGGASIISFNMFRDDLETLMIQPWTMTSSDGGLVPWMEGVPHPRSYGAFPRKIRKYVLDEQLMSLGQAVKSMTGLPAQVFRIEDRGLLRVGSYADILVFDLSRINDPATFTNPHQLAEGMVHVFVGGETAISDGQFTGVMAGKIITRN
jgi:N-acyl-D-amino-acid deacylase